MTKDKEASRIGALVALDILDTAPEEAFDRLTSLAADLFDAPIALVSLIDTERQWFKARHGLDATSTPRDLAFCAHAIELEADAVMVVEDATCDPRFRANALVTGEPHVTFYAGAVLTDRDGHNLGTLCVIDTKPRARPSADDIRRLETLARIVVDELALRRATRQATEKQKLLTLAERMSGVGHWRLHTASGRVEWSEELYRIHGVTREAFDPNLSEAMSFYDEADAARIYRLVAHAMRTGQGYEFEMRIRRPDGEYRDVACKADCQFDDKGEVEALFGVFQDVTERNNTQIAVALSEERFRRLAVNAPDIIAESGLNGIMTYMSPACLPMTGFTPEELVGKPFADLMEPEDAALVEDMCRQVIASKGEIVPWPVEFRARHKDGRELWLECKPTPAVDPVTGRYDGLTDVIRDVTARKAMEAQLRQARAAAEEAAAVKAEFLANMSHELRTPLTSILGFTRLTAEQAELSELTRTYVERVADASRALLCTVNDVLDFSKLEAGQVTIKREPTSLAPLGRATLDLFTPQAGAKDVRLVLDLQMADDLVITLDPDRVRQVLLNLVGNAVKFTEAGQVTLRAAYDPIAQRLRISVLDTGPGVEPDKLDLLFKRFSQVDGSLTRAHGGSGLGLAICKGLVEAMDGRIGVDSQPGQGSRFWFEIPAPIAIKARAATPGQAFAAPTFAGVRVLVVDDHAANRDLARLFLTGVGAEVSDAVDGAEAIEMAGSWPYDVILMDMRMPGLDGPETLARIRAQPGPNDATPVLAFTANMQEEDPRQLAALGFQDVVAKPIDPAALIGAISRATDFAPQLPDQIEEIARVA